MVQQAGVLVVEFAGRSAAMWSLCTAMETVKRSVEPWSSVTGRFSRKTGVRFNGRRRAGLAVVELSWRPGVSGAAGPDGVVHPVK
ncbi:hypothetical protein ACIBO2_52040 [Nonomuraea sp. NPDC050022]|uniref:hypothetical protein n=1 Tax=Nonomuraea sp. NPDC050022 TaxID=3364358 RepID=UPI00379B96F5